jgi:hypothetical protein
VYYATFGDISIKTIIPPSRTLDASPSVRLSMRNALDIEIGHPTSATPPLEGFAAAAEWLAQDGDDETLIFRKFGEIGVRNLLYLQCEILLLRKRLGVFDATMSNDDAEMELKDAARTWETLVELCEQQEERAIEQMGLIRELRGKMREYCTSRRMFKRKTRRAHY